MSRLLVLRSLAALAACSGLACSGESVTQGFEEPIRALDTQFREGSLPGSAPLTADEVNAGVQPALPTVTSVTLPNSLIPQGEPSRTFRGRATEQAKAVAVRFPDMGSGYWLLPTRNPDPLSAGELEWSFNAAFRHDVPAGLHRLLFAAVDADGKSGSQAELTLCITPEVPDNGNSCDPSTSPPALVLSLSWDAPVDLDLRVITPSGKVVDSKHPTTANEDEEGNLDPNEPGAGAIDHDSQAHCLDDGRRRENLVFQGPPIPGTYLVYANLYDACGEPGALFDVSLYTAVTGSDPDTFAVQKTFTQAGQLQAVHANGGSKLGMFVTSFNAL